jgi:hypothetical protein
MKAAMEDDIGPKGSGEPSGVSRRVSMRVTQNACANPTPYGVRLALWLFAFANAQVELAGLVAAEAGRDDMEDAVLGRPDHDS